MSRSEVVLGEIATGQVQCLGGVEGAEPAAVCVKEGAPFDNGEERVPEAARYGSRAGPGGARAHVRKRASDVTATALYSLTAWRLPDLTFLRRASLAVAGTPVR